MRDENIKPLTEAMDIFYKNLPSFDRQESYPDLLAFEFMEKYE